MDMYSVLKNRDHMSKREINLYLQQSLNKTSFGKKNELKKLNAHRKSTDAPTEFDYNLLTIVAFIIGAAE